MTERWKDGHDRRLRFFEPISMLYSSGIASIFVFSLAARIYFYVKHPAFGWACVAFVVLGCASVAAAQVMSGRRGR
jgi:hypothetical protein